MVKAGYTFLRTNAFDYDFAIATTPFIGVHFYPTDIQDAFFETKNETISKLIGTNLVLWRFEDATPQNPTVPIALTHILFLSGLNILSLVGVYQVFGPVLGIFDNFELKGSMTFNFKENTFEFSVRGFVLTRVAGYAYPYGFMAIDSTGSGKFYQESKGVETLIPEINW